MDNNVHTGFYVIIHMNNVHYPLFSISGSLKYVSRSGQLLYLSLFCVHKSANSLVILLGFST